MIRLTDEQRERIRNHFPEEHFPDGRPGHKLIPTRRVLEAVLWILSTGAQMAHAFAKLSGAALNGFLQYRKRLAGGQLREDRETATSADGGGRLL